MVVSRCLKTWFVVMLATGCAAAGSPAERDGRVCQDKPVLVSTPTPESLGSSRGQVAKAIFASFSEEPGSRIKLSSAPVSSSFPQPPRHARASSIAMDRVACTSEKLEQVGKGYRLQLTTSSAPSHTELLKAFDDEIHACQQQGSQASDYHSETFGSGGLNGVKVQFSAAGEHTLRWHILDGNHLIIATAQWTDDTRLPIVERFLSSVRAER